MHTKHPRWTAPTLAAALTLLAPAHAQTQRSGGGETQKIMQQYQQVAAEKTALQTQLAQLKRDLDAANTELAAVKKERDAAKAHAGVPAATVVAANGARDAAERNLEQSKQRMNELVGRFRETAGNLKEAEADRAKLRQDVADRDKVIDTCVAHNMELYGMNREILDRYEHVGLFTKAGASEPFTRITRTRLENIADEYRQRADELKVKKPAP
jgi:chromosome segregation ATPase